MSLSEKMLNTETQPFIAVTSVNNENLNILNETSKQKKHVISPTTIEENIKISVTLPNKSRHKRDLNSILNDSQLLLIGDTKRSRTTRLNNVKIVQVAEEEIEFDN